LLGLRYLLAQSGGRNRLRESRKPVSPGSWAIHPFSFSISSFCVRDLKTIKAIFVEVKRNGHIAAGLD
jgi:hypothetical protein